MAEGRDKNHGTVLRICVAGLFMGLNILMSSFSVPVPGGHLYLNDVVIDNWLTTWSWIRRHCCLIRFRPSL